MRSVRWLLLALALVPAAHADSERALVLTLRWDGDRVSVENTERREMEVPLSRGFPQLQARFFELRDRPGEDGDVHYAAALGVPRLVRDAAGDAGAPTYRIVVPDLAGARRLVVYRRDARKGPVVVLEQDL